MLKLYNDLSNRKETFQPLEAGKVRMYVCGMTVYDLCHLGHARVMVVFDVVYRYLRASGYEVNYIRNITDIDDKIINRANEKGVHFADLTKEFIQAMHQDADALGVLRPSDEPKATEHMDEILAMITRLIDKGHAYAVENGDVYYDVRSFSDYGKLSGKSIEDLRAGARVEPGDVKRDPLDFALWKGAKPDEPAWDSPWGRGRPGWHIECSAMSTKALGDSFDIHGGGADLTFPHHENEIAQSEGATGHPFVKYWMHNGFVRINDEKMSKSLGNFFTVREILEHYRAEEVRYFILTSHYRSPLNYDTEHLDNARAALTRFYTALRGLPESATAVDESYVNRFRDAMDDDFNTPEALAVLFDLAREINRLKETDSKAAASLAAQLRELGGMLGILQDDAENYLRGTAPADEDGLNDEAIEAMIQARIDARTEKNWGEADRIRDDLQAAGIILEDGPQGTSWRRG
ncbi:MAG: cysteine--tRNA ligase [gamma proteobacterium symbiont of Ctena orbiculata]|uniref:Cysteine--tRNA ligase n=1 Tax=Candidatus Thiodiazotropha taylori TaxID=2792791 RepID=A0A944QTB5_9GAMM|nr:cysteine--tRNA ligase [Candidatus Thiodiazotropha taylori]PUB88542.1 MAG: cysteine--tRNA ligase [gamma proteobacterium symbiont of Ctena orbiculata]MBT2989778.1 cysteine--tRNA ligase [Candidatus Thiodiazotropha taylori]MBT2995883.1 cysteine--tRNA ligase [Candidatus Thiodiazotropha taylori]MBT2999198.1 cysteine--tRNA ligase [Candidatus Thiodiazotropha taylori]